MNLDTLDSKLDVGRESCSFYDAGKKNSEYVETVLRKYMYRFMEIERCIKDFSSVLSEDIRRSLVLPTVARHIYISSRLEFEEYGDSYEDTLQYILLRLNETKKEQKEAQLTNMLQLLNRTYSDSPISEKEFTIEKLEEWHGTLFNGIYDHAGRIRKSGLVSNNPDGSPQRYPHHTVVKPALTSLCKWSRRVIQDFERDTNPEEWKRIGVAFALASFLQFHFVDIHPFLDGNGRMCRFLSKYVLDSVLPLPIPMFEDRSRYIESLATEGRVSSFPGPMKLLDLLLETTEQFYEDIICRYKNYKPLRCLGATHYDELQNLEAPPNVVEYFQNEFNDLEENDTKEFELEGVRYIFRREIDWENL